MASYADSRASFKHRVLEVGLTEAQYGELDSNDLRTFNALAFAVCGNANPGEIDPTRFQNLMTTVFTHPTLGLESSLRQLSYEAITIAVAAIRQRVEPTEEGQVKKLPPQERDERIRRQAAKITGFKIQGDLEPAHATVDLFTTMLEECALKYVPLSRCISREHELQALKQDTSIVILENNQLQVKNKQPESVADISNEWKIHNAFLRRGLAGEQANLFSHDVHEMVRHEFMSHLGRPAPPGFRSADIQAVLRADRELWSRVIDKCKSNIKVDAAGKFPVDIALTELYQSPSVVFHLLPVPSGKKRAASEESHSVKKSKKAKKEKKANDDRAERVKVPQTLKDFKGVNANKQRVCYNYNLAHGCSNKTHVKDKMTRCVKGNHQCIKCYGDHPLMQCPKQ